MGTSHRLSPGPAFSLLPAAIFCGITLPGSTTGLCTNMPFSTTLRAILYRIPTPALLFLIYLHTILCSLEEQNRQNECTLNGGLLHGLTRYGLGGSQCTVLKAECLGSSNLVMKA